MLPPAPHHALAHISFPFPLAHLPHNPCFPQPRIMPLLPSPSHYPSLTSLMTFASPSPASCPCSHLLPIPPRSPPSQPLLPSAPHHALAHISFPFPLAHLPYDPCFPQPCIMPLLTSPSHSSSLTSLMTLASLSPSSCPSSLRLPFHTLSPPSQPLLPSASHHALAPLASPFPLAHLPPDPCFPQPCIIIFLPCLPIHTRSLPS